MGGSLKSFNEPVLTLMTGRVSDGKLIGLREKVCGWTFGNLVTLHFTGPQISW